MATISSCITKEAKDKQIDTTTAFGRAWLLEKVDKLNPRPEDRAKILKDRELQRTQIMVGRMYFFRYDPKTKDTLPYWDIYPIVIPIEPYRNGFLGLNLHYIYPKDRLILLTQLQNFATASKGVENTRLRLSYPILKAYHQAYRAKPCIKRYLYNHVMSRFSQIPGNEWNIAAALPVQQFKAEFSVQAEQVWRDSKRKY